MYTKDQMIKLTHQIEQNLEEYIEFINLGNPDSDVSSYIRSKKRKGELIERVLNTKLEEYRVRNGYQLPLEFATLWAFLLADATIAENDVSSFNKTTAILNALTVKKSTLKKPIPNEAIEKLREGLRSAYQRVSENLPKSFSVNQVIEQQIIGIQENYRLNQMKLAYRMEIEDHFMTVVNDKVGKPHQYEEKRKEQEATNLYPLGNQSIQEQEEVLKHLKNRLIEVMNNW